MELLTLKLEDLPHYTYDDYLQWDGDWELIVGVPYSLESEPVIKHQNVIDSILLQIHSCISDHTELQLFPALDWLITADTVVRPDILVISDENPDEAKIVIPPELVIEVLSPATWKKDRGIKGRLYQEAGVKYYCLVDPDLESIEVLQLSGELFRPAFPPPPGKVELKINQCLITLDIDKIFNRKKRD